MTEPDPSQHHPAHRPAAYAERPAGRGARPIRSTGAGARGVDRSRDVAALLARRPDLVGVHQPADTVAATVTWAV